MPVEYQLVRCGNCGCELDEPPRTAAPEPQKCPQCGSTARRVEMGIGDTVTTRDSLSFKARSAGCGRPSVDGRVCDDLHRKSGHWFRLERIIDRARNWYRELIGDPQTGEVIRHVEEPLSKHIGHGAGRRSAGEKDRGDV